MAATKEWDLEPDNTIVVLDGGKSEVVLIDRLESLTWWCDGSFPQLRVDEYVIFREPDLNNQLTGFAIKPGLSIKSILSLPLIFSTRGGEK